MTCSDHLIISWFLLGLKRGRKNRKVVAKKNFVSNKHTVIYIYINMTKKSGTEKVRR